MSQNGKTNGGVSPLAPREERQRLMRLSPRQRVAALYDAEDTPALVRSLPAEDLYVTIQEVGLADMTELVQLASPAQFRTFVDLGGWAKDKLDPHAVLTWLRAARGDEQEDFLRKVHAVDLEVVETLLKEFTVVHDLEENPDVNPQGVTLETPEGRYLVELKVEGIEMSAMRALLNDLIAENPFEAVRLFEAVRWEIPSELEETAFQFRRARLSDLGFPSLEDALALFSRVDVPPRPTGPGTPALTAAGGHVDYLEAAFRDLSDVERMNAEDELREVANAVLVAELCDPGDLDAVRRVGEWVRDYLSLGLEHLTGGDPAKAPEALRDTPLRRVFQVGFTLTLQLKYRADRLFKVPFVKLDDVPLVLPEEAAALEALRRKRPRRALRVPGAEAVPFRSLREVAGSEALLARAEGQVAALGALLGGSEDAAHTVLARFGVSLDVLGVERLWAAVVGMAVLEERVDVRPVPLGRTVELGQRLFEGTPEAPRLRPSAAERAVAALSPEVPEAAREELRRVVNVTLARLLSELGPAWLREGRLDLIASAVLPMESAPVP
ncbi:MULTISPECIES: DUF6178 family protein [unclassified Corallococcus]|uniref:DUF6178 family protein n=1 Tax=unclassified Corallococcus TaxID=2685029 RepID=UPI001A8DEC1C|nr:DUF6178 family protein [Corallococcus sp. NCRR]MBN9684319.1 hypothetical protein [Corallococcus sp. NCSPR001]WAS84200.1 DUF6178 family protein [Corallococcus sp. NCRR]